MTDVIQNLRFLMRQLDELCIAVYLYPVRTGMV